MLAEETTLTPPPYVEGESDQITVTNADETQAGLFTLKDIEDITRRREDM